MDYFLDKDTFYVCINW